MVAPSFLEHSKDSLLRGKFAQAQWASRQTSLTSHVLQPSTSRVRRRNSETPSTWRKMLSASRITGRCLKTGIDAMQHRYASSLVQKVSGAIGLKSIMAAHVIDGLLVMWIHLCNFEAWSAEPFIYQECSCWQKFVKYPLYLLVRQYNLKYVV